MAVRVLMPKGSDTMTEGKVLKWLKQEGDKISSGDAVVEIETDKVDMEVEAMGSGVLRKVLVNEGSVVPVGQLLGVIGRPDEDIAKVVAEAAPAVAEPAQAPEAQPQAEAVSRPPAPPSVKTLPSQPAPQGGPPASVVAEFPAPQAAVGGRLRASPLARRMAQEMGIDLSRIVGSGPSGRITRGDIERAAAAGSVAPSVREGPQIVPLMRMPAPGGPDFHDEPMSQMRKTIATRLVQSIGPVPHFFLTIEVDMKRAKDLIESANQLDAEFPFGPLIMTDGKPAINPTSYKGLKVTYNDLIIKACSVVLRAHPEVNVSFRGDTIRFHNRVHIGVAVATEGGLITPVIRDCDRKSLAQISMEAKELVARARQRKLQPEEYTGSTFSISNLGMMGIEEFTAVINPPEGAILAVGAVVEKPVVNDGRLEIGHRCRMTMSCDHRVVDGATGAKFLQTLKKILENPVYLAF